MHKLTVTLLLFSNLFIQISTSEDPSAELLSRKNYNEDYCPCFPRGITLYPELIEHQKHNLERLVVYLYKNPRNGRIKMVIPNEKKQRHIPNIPIDEDDILKTVKTETVVSLMEPKARQVWPFIIKVDPIQTHWGTLEHVPQKDNPYLPYLQKKRYPQKGLASIAKPLDSHYGSYYMPHRNDYGQQISKPPSHNLNLHSPHDVYHASPHVVHNKRRTTTVRPDDGYRDGDELPNDPTVVPSPLYSGNRYSTFDKWYNQRIKSLQSNNMPQNLDLNKQNHLKDLLINTLYENHMYIEGGLIKNEHGEDVSFNNLELRPVLIGNTVPYEHVFNGVHHVPLPRHSPFLKGVLVTLTHPQKILGFIPIKRTFISEAGPHESAYNLETYVKHYSINTAGLPKDPSSLNHVLHLLNVNIPQENRNSSNPFRYYKDDLSLKRPVPKDNQNSWLPEPKASPLDREVSHQNTFREEPHLAPKVVPNKITLKWSTVEPTSATIQVTPHKHDQKLSPVKPTKVSIQAVPQKSNQNWMLAKPRPKTSTNNNRDWISVRASGVPSKDNNNPAALVKPSNSIVNSTETPIKYTKNFSIDLNAPSSSPFTKANDKISDLHANAYPLSQSTSVPYKNQLSSQYYSDALKNLVQSLRNAESKTDSPDNIQVVTPGQTRRTGGISSLPDALKSAVNMLLRTINTNKSSRRNEPENKNGTNADEQPGVRIIGGTPATGSGVPVRNKGRDGKS